MVPKEWDAATRTGCHRGDVKHVVPGEGYESGRTFSDSGYFSDMDIYAEKDSQIDASIPALGLP